MSDCERIVGKGRLRCLHVNDSQTPLGSNRDRHAPLGEGELGKTGCAAFLSEPRFEDLPAIFEGPGHGRQGADGEGHETREAATTEGPEGASLRPEARGPTYSASRRSKNSGFTHSKGSPLPW